MFKNFEALNVYLIENNWEPIKVEHLTPNSHTTDSIIKQVNRVISEMEGIGIDVRSGDVINSIYYPEAHLIKDPEKLDKYLCMFDPEMGSKKFDF